MSDVNYNKNPITHIPREAEEKFDEWIDVLSEDMFQSIEKQSLPFKIRSWVRQYIHTNKIKSLIFISIAFICFIATSIILSFFILSIILLSVLLLYLIVFHMTHKTQVEIGEYTDFSSRIDIYKVRIGCKKGEELVEKGMYQEALKMYKNLSINHPTVWYVYNNIGFCELKLNKLDDALLTYENFKGQIEETEKDEDIKTTYLSIINNQIGCIYERKSHLDLAYKHYNHSNVLRESNASLINLLSICIKMNKFDEAYIWFSKLKASKDYNEAISLLPQKTILQLKKLSWIR